MFLRFFKIFSVYRSCSPMFNGCRTPIKQHKWCFRHLQWEVMVLKILWETHHWCKKKTINGKKTCYKNIGSCPLLHTGQTTPQTTFNKRVITIYKWLLTASRFLATYPSLSAHLHHHQSCSSLSPLLITVSLSLTRRVNSSPLSALYSYALYTALSTPSFISMSMVDNRLRLWHMHYYDTLGGKL